MIFKNLGFNNITVTHRDVLNNGFKPMENENYVLENIDSVFLDLPRPYDVIINTKEILRKGGKICLFSPCIE
jgi:tRNA (adenine57-N1/adenine58-N1)-methyltransferase